VRPGYPGTVIIGIDTSLGTAVAAIARDGEVLADEQSADPLGHAEVIGDLLARAIRVASAPTHVAIGMGPGPFTGLRVGIATARAFALGRGIRAVPVPSHDGIALGVLLADALTDTETPRFAAVTDARRKEFAYSVYEGLDDDGLPLRITDAALSPRDDLDARLAEAGAARYDATSVSAAMIALAAARALDAGRVLAGPEPLYLRSPDVVAAHAPKRVSA
jgi:tRNA threonylcarbamoyladenosine biosynthesis protein TsaB